MTTGTLGGRLVRRASRGIGRAWPVLRVVLAGTSAAVIGGAAWMFVLGAPVERARFAHPRDAVTVLDRSGVPLRHQRVDSVDRRWVPLEEISPRLVEAVIAVEDHRFRSHRGVDGLALLRAVATSVVPGRRTSGASTITQQLIKRVYGRSRGALLSKPGEIARAVTLERRFDKDWILEQYLNRLPYGNGIIGIGRASEVYFGRPPSALGWSEAALLAGVPQAPSRTEPRRHGARAERRRRFVLSRLRDLGRIDETTYRAALDDPPTLSPRAFRPWRAPRFVDRALADWREGELEAERGRLETSLDQPLQAEAEDILEGAVQRHHARGVRNGAAVAVRHETGEILAYVGAALRGPDQPAGEMDLLRARRQPGSTLKPFAYELWFERGGTAASLLDDIPRPMVSGDGRIFEAENYDRRARGPVRARVALASSLNLAALDVVRRVGTERFVDRLAALGLTLEAPEELGAAVVLGGADITALGLAEAYATVARGGARRALTSGVASGPDAGPEQPLLDPTAVSVVRDILRDGQARRAAFGADLEAFFDHRPFGLKTGTSSGFRDAWTAVFSEEVTVVVWLGDPSGAGLDELSGFAGAAEPAVRILRAAEARLRALSVTPFSPGDAPLVPAAVCADTGHRAGAGCRHTVVERFAADTVPTTVCDRHGPDGSVRLPARYARWLETVRPPGFALDDQIPTDTAPRIEHPAPRARWLLDPRRPAPSVPLRASVGGRAAPDVRWEVDGEPLDGARWTLVEGRHEIVAVVGGWRSSGRVVEVVVAR